MRVESAPALGTLTAAARESQPIPARPVTHRIRETALAILKANSNGVRWADLGRMIGEADASFHPKTINGIVWKLCETYPELVEKPEPGLFRLKRKE